MEPFQYKLFYYKNLKKHISKNKRYKKNKSKKVTFSPEVTFIPIKNNKKSTIYNYTINLLSVFYSNADSYNNNYNEK
jgi:hypothetical protein